MGYVMPDSEVYVFSNGSRIEAGVATFNPIFVVIPVGTEWTARADSDRCRNRLQNCNPRFYAAAVDQHRFHGLGNAISLDFGCAVFGHEADSNAANYRHKNYPGSKLVMSRAGEFARR